jgi:hypothetical protein
VCPACSCGAPPEDANHFLCVWTKYSEIKNDLCLSISNLSQLINASLLTSESETLSYENNGFIFNPVLVFQIQLPYDHGHNGPFPFKDTAGTNQ